jgi:SH3-like domain-containing protein
MKKSLLLLCLLLLSVSAMAQIDYKTDSLKRIEERYRHDFSLTPDEGRRQIEARIGAVSDDSLNAWKSRRFIETANIDGQEMWFRKAVSNFWLLGPDNICTGKVAKKKETYNTYKSYYDEAMASEPDINDIRDWHRVTLTFRLDVKADAVPAGETIRAWLPFPFENLRQRNIELLRSSYDVHLSEGSLHHTAYMEAKAVKGQITRFEITFRYDVGERHIDRSELLSRLKPYDKTSADYIHYTQSEAPHILITNDMRTLAKKLVGKETNPVLQASLLYDWIAKTFPWAGAREYSTIQNIPEYVLREKHGDCGQVSLLYITLLRSIGIPARWESGWAIEPTGAGYHDWTEVYFEGVGWVPADPSYGRDTRNEPLADYYKNGLDFCRLATNQGICGQLNPKKEFVRCETVDFQAGEAEWRGGNLEYKDFDSKMTINSFLPIKADSPMAKEPRGIVKLSTASLRFEGSHAAEMATQAIMGTPVRILEKDDDWYLVQTPDSYIAYIPESSLTPVDSIRYHQWLKAKRFIVTTYQSRLVSEPNGDETVTDLTLGCLLEYKAKKGKWIRLATPDGREGWILKDEVEDFEDWALQSFNAQLIERTARRMMGSGYLWGGTTTKITDCSGLAKVSYFANAIILQRDASQQACTGKKIEASDWRNAETGDLLFFGSSRGKVTHVALYLRDGQYIHCSGQVKINSLDPVANDYLDMSPLSISRINGYIGTHGIMAVRHHPWYFEIKNENQ